MSEPQNRTPASPGEDPLKDAERGRFRWGEGDLDVLYDPYEGQRKKRQM